MVDENKIEEHKRKIAISIIDSLDNLYDLRGDITIKTIHYYNPDYHTIEVTDSFNSKIGINIKISINIHKLK